MTRLDETVQPIMICGNCAGGAHDLCVLGGCTCECIGKRKPDPDFRQAARNIRRKHLPWDEYPQYCAPGGVSDQLEADIAAALQSAWKHQPIDERPKFNRHGTPYHFD